MVEVVINGVRIDLISKEVKYIRQANDLADISTVNTSFTYSIRADKTPKNTQLFEQLGMVGDTSRTPYLKNTAQLIDNGAVLIEKGLATVKETNDEYKLFIQDGIIEVFKLIENKTLGTHLDLSELDHDKKAETIIDSWNEETPYRYLIADYNGRTNDGNSINAQYQVPSVSVKYLWDKIFSYLGYTYSGDFDFIADKWMTYPKPLEIEESELNLSFLASKSDYSGGWNDEYKEWESTYPAPLEDVTLIQKNGRRWAVKINYTGKYSMGFRAEGLVNIDLEYPLNDMMYPDREDIQGPFRVNLLIDGEVIESTLSNEPFEKGLQLPLQADTIIELEIVPADPADITDATNPQRNLYERGKYEIDRLDIDYLQFGIITMGKENLDFSSVLSDFSIKDFFKEVMFRGGLTPFPDNITKHIDFRNLKERFDTKPQNVFDLSANYVKRTNEKYTFGTYAQRNILRLKYNNEEESYSDGFIRVENANIEDEKPLFNSKFYAPERERSTISFETTENEVPLIKLWEKEVKEVEGEQEIEYKPLNNRFYMLSTEWSNENILVNDLSTAGFYTASLSGTTMREVVNSKYNLIHRIFTDTRIHDLELVLTAHDFQSLPLDKLHYVAQEGQFYILNKIVWESGKIAKGEFLRVKKI